MCDGVKHDQRQSPWLTIRCLVCFCACNPRLLRQGVCPKVPCHLSYPALLSCSG